LKSDLAHSAELNKQTKKRGKLIAHQKRNAQVFTYQLKQMAINLVVMGSTLLIVTYYYKGVTVAKLPFQPPVLMAKLTHRWYTCGRFNARAEGTCGAHVAGSMHRWCTCGSFNVKV
ncbi:hypothetical protein DUNSADRAFT_12636, partial [Dunaliella salina]